MRFYVSAPDFPIALGPLIPHRPVAQCSERCGQVVVNALLFQPQDEFVAYAPLRYARHPMEWLAGHVDRRDSGGRFG